MNIHPTLQKMSTKFFKDNKLCSKQTKKRNEGCLWKHFTMNLRKIRESKNIAEEINEDRIINQKKITQNRD